VGRGESAKGGEMKYWICYYVVVVGILTERLIYAGQHHLTLSQSGIGKHLSLFLIGVAVTSIALLWKNFDD
jgi:hypothetical protein